ncbi:hypothetical protein J6590_035534 [Homalodisca vitripennis]|nr:hypothetical protein J6590_035534 [Homalodisca vitripennis]
MARHGQRLALGRGRGGVNRGPGFESSQLPVLVSRPTSTEAAHLDPEVRCARTFNELCLRGCVLIHCDFGSNRFTPLGMTQNAILSTADATIGRTLSEYLTALVLCSPNNDLPRIVPLPALTSLSHKGL